MAAAPAGHRFIAVPTVVCTLTSIQTDPCCMQMHTLSVQWVTCLTHSLFSWRCGLLIALHLVALELSSAIDLTGDYFRQESSALQETHGLA